MGQINFLTGLDQVLYMTHEDSAHRHQFLQQVNCSGEYLVHKVSDGHPGSTTAKAETYGFSDQIFTGYVWYKRPGIKGIHRKNSQSFPCDKDLKRKRVERKVLRAFKKDEDDEEGEDGEDDEDADEISSALSSLLRKEYGCTGPRQMQDVEQDDQSVATRATNSPSRQKYYAYYVEGWVYALTQQLTIMLGTVTVDTVIDKFMYLIHDVSVCESKKMGLREMTGRLPTGLSAEEEREMLIQLSSRNGEGWLPIPLWHTHITKKALHTCAMDWSPPEYHLHVAPWDKIIRRSSRDTKVVKADGRELASEDLFMALVLYHLYIDGNERDIVADNEFDLLITKHDHRKQRGSFNAINIKWSGPTTAVWWIVVRDSCVADNDHWNWWGFFGMEPVVEATIMFGTNVRQPTLSGMFYRIVQAFEKCVATPEVCAYMYGFCFRVYDHDTVNCSANLLRYTEATVDISLQKYLTVHDAITVYIFREAYMLLNHSKGSVLPIR